MFLCVRFSTRPQKYLPPWHRLIENSGKLVEIGVTCDRVVKGLKGLGTKGAEDGVYRMADWHLELR